MDEAIKIRSETKQSGPRCNGGRLVRTGVLKDGRTKMTLANPDLESRPGGGPGRSGRWLFIVLLLFTATAAVVTTVIWPNYDTAVLVVVAVIIAIVEISSTPMRGVSR